MFWKPAGMKPAAMATGIWGGGTAFWDGGPAGTRGLALPPPAREPLLAPGKLDVGSGGALQLAGDCHTSTQPCKGASATLSLRLKTTQ